MDVFDKLKILSQDSQYDLACACGTANDDHRKRGRDGKWLYPVSLPRGGHSVLLKTLLSNACTNDCKYCPLRSGTDVRRCTLQPEEVARVFMEYQRTSRIFGLFLSSGVIHNPDYTMDRINTVARLLRYRHSYKGYIHLKLIPGASDAAIEDSLSLASSVSLNIETPGQKNFAKLSDKKDYEKDIIRPLKLISRLTGKGMRYSRVKRTTQFIVGASTEKDAEIINYMSGLYDRLHFNRIYFSAYQRGLGVPVIPGETHVPSHPDDILTREHRLYQVDFLMRKYGFGKGEIPLDQNGNLSLDADPKQAWADSNPDFYPVRINTAGRKHLLKVPGLGLVSVERILHRRREKRITAMRDIGISGKRAEKIRGYVVFE